MFGLAGQLVKGMVQKSSQPDWKSQVVDLCDLPEEVLNNSDWPISKCKRPVIVLRREAVNRLEQSGGIILVEAYGETFKFGLNFFGRGKIIEQIRQLGWQI